MWRHIEYEVHDGQVQEPVDDHVLPKVRDTHPQMDELN